VSTYLPDTNVIIDLAWRNSTVRAKVENAERSGSRFVIAPPVITELAFGVVKGGTKYFEQSLKVFTWLQAHSSNILELPLPFVGDILGFPMRRTQVETQHYRQLIGMIVNSQTFDEFLTLKDQVGSLWTDIDRAPQIHPDKVNDEFTSLEMLARRPPEKVDVAAGLCKAYTPASASVDAMLFRHHFSAAVEYAEAALAKIRGGVNLREKDRGRYGDFNLLFYLADPNISLLTNDGLTGDIKQSPQRTRIVKPDDL
jgi:hypothetical protein